MACVCMILSPVACTANGSLCSDLSFVRHFDLFGDVIFVSMTLDGLSRFFYQKPTIYM